MRKFEFTMRHAVHEHEISKRIFIFPKYERIWGLLTRPEPVTLRNLKPDDFVEVEFKADRLASYSHIIRIDFEAQRKL